MHPIQGTSRIWMRCSQRDVRKVQTQVCSTHRFKSHQKRPAVLFSPTPCCKHPEKSMQNSPPRIIPAHSSNSPSLLFTSPFSLPSLRDSGSSRSRAQTSSPTPIIIVSFSRPPVPFRGIRFLRSRLRILQTPRGPSPARAP